MCGQICNTKLTLKTRFKTIIKKQKSFDLCGQICNAKLILKTRSKNYNKIAKNPLSQLDLFFPVSKLVEL